MSSDLRSFCRREYARRVAMRLDISSELKRALRTHERVPTFIDKLAKEFAHPKIRRDISRETMVKAIHDMTDLFIKNVDRLATERRMSDIEKTRILRREEHLQLARDIADSLTGEEEVSRDAQGNETTHETIQID